MYCFGVHPVEIRKGKYQRERLHSELQQDSHTFQHTQNTGIFQGKLTEVKGITNNMMVFPFKLLLPKLLNILEHYFNTFFPSFGKFPPFKDKRSKEST